MFPCDKDEEEFKKEKANIRTGWQVSYVDDNINPHSFRKSRKQTCCLKISMAKISAV